VHEEYPVAILPRYFRALIDGRYGVTMDKTTLASFLNPRVLQLIILPTEQCNFRCTYCYEDFEIGQMEARTVEAIKLLILKRLPSLKMLYIAWFGGEPLMAKSHVFELSEFAQKECEKAGVAFSSNMTTNAFGLDPATFQTLAKFGMRKYQISLDGDEEGHNKTRKMISGRGSFSKIWNNLLAMRDSKEEFLVRLRVHVHHANIDSIRRLIGKLNAEFGGDPRFEIFMKAIGNWGGDSVKQMNLIKDSKIVIAELKSLLGDGGWFNARPDALKEGPFSPCYAAIPSSFVIRADGSLAKCTVAFNDPRNRIGHIKDDGTLYIENDKVHQFMRGFEDGDQGALHCPMKSMPAAEEVKVIKFEKLERVSNNVAEPA
jgi:uncharacterized protein